jgi:four helix bundle protein
MDKEKFKSDFSKRLIKFSLEVIRLCRDLETNKTLRVIANQLIRSACSIGANVIEAKCSSSKKEYARYFGIALNSANESIYWLILTENSEVKFAERSKKLRAEAQEIAKILAASLITLRGRNK